MVLSSYYTFVLGVPLERNALKKTGNAVVHNIYRLCQQHRIGLEMLPTREACATFNFLNSERRNVAAGLIPPSIIISSDENYATPARSRRFLIDNTITTDIATPSLQESAETTKKILAGQVTPIDPGRTMPTDKKK